MDYVQSTAVPVFFIPSEMYCWSGQLNQAVSSISGELCALLEALRPLLHRGPRQWLLATHSRALLSARGCTSFNAELSSDIALLSPLLVSKNADVRSQWIPSHVNVMGIEGAERLAVDALNIPVATVPAPS